MNHSPAAPYSSATTPRSSLTSSTSGPRTPRTPLTKSDGSAIRASAARASVFDAYLKLGMFEENSPLATWVFNDGRSATSNTTCCDFPSTDTVGSSPQACRFREKSGSRFRERLDSDSPIFVLNNWKEDDDDSGSSRSSKNSKPSGRPLQNRSTASQRQNTISFASNSTTAVVPQQQSNAARRPFSIFRTRRPRISSVSDLSVAGEEVPVTSRKKITKRPPFSRVQTHPPPMPSTVAYRHEIDEDQPLSPLRRPSVTSSSDWEKIDPLSSFDFNTLASTDNPFLHGPQSSTPKSRRYDGPLTESITSSSQVQIPFPSTPPPSPSTLMQRLSAVVTRPFHISSNRGQRHSDSHARPKVHSLRRTQSSVAGDTTAASSRPFLSSTPPSVTIRMHRLTPFMSHS
ncbi:hypothetical protein E1B28_002357 [Marasmius oreades]|uniref:Uncharacterized protein n=1 Tax=Marasmius oreades TaxID=181124 RepID=A0A9P7UKI8_9AGAR|nr:uncharacterized protein E1B28_002357 [Marasmius oreades]KAG7086402.1 hypothetical protein E1B28_002357 [Marasmius oreades]